MIFMCKIVKKVVVTTFIARSAHYHIVSCMNSIQTFKSLLINQYQLSNFTHILMFFISNFISRDYSYLEKKLYKLFKYLLYKCLTQGKIKIELEQQRTVSHNHITSNDKRTTFELNAKSQQEQLFYKMHIFSIQKLTLKFFTFIQNIL